MGTYRVQLSTQVLAFLQAMDEKSRRICSGNLGKLVTGPYPGRGSGDKERLPVRGEQVFRLHIGRRYTAFYIVVGENTVRVFELLPIDQAHKKYGYK